MLKRLEGLFGKFAKHWATIEEKEEDNQRREEAARVAKQLNNAKALDNNIARQLKVLDMIKAKQLASAKSTEVHSHVPTPAFVPALQPIQATESKNNAIVEMPSQP